MSASAPNIFVNEKEGRNLVVRLAISLCLGFVITYFLFFMMQLLIAMGTGTMDESDNGRVVDFIRVKNEPEVATKERKPKKPPKPEPPPPDVAPQQMSSSAPVEGGMSMDVPMDTDLGGKGGFNLAAQDGDYLPIVRVSPIYPRRAQNRGIEGYCVVELTVTKNGSTKNVVVIDAEPEGIFNRASVNAASKFKYKPKMEDGNAVEVNGVTYKFTYALDK
jgi:protein TonB